MISNKCTCKVPHTDKYLNIPKASKPELQLCQSCYEKYFKLGFFGKIILWIKINIINRRRNKQYA